MSGTTELRREIERLEGLVYSPGNYICGGCQFVLTSQTLNMGDGTVTANEVQEPCPNGCGLMRRLTERERADMNAKGADQQAERAFNAENELAALRPALADKPTGEGDTDLSTLEQVAGDLERAMGHEGFAGMFPKTSLEFGVAAREIRESVAALRATAHDSGLREALEVCRRIDKSWTAVMPEGPDAPHDYAGALDDEYRELWVLVRTALRATPHSTGGDEA